MKSDEIIYIVCLTVRSLKFRPFYNGFISWKLNIQVVAALCVLEMRHEDRFGEPFLEIGMINQGWNVENLLTVGGLKVPKIILLWCRNPRFCVPRSSCDFAKYYLKFSGYAA